MNTPVSRPLDRKDVATAIALAAFVVVLFLMFLRPPFLSDQLDYFYHAWQLHELNPSHRHLRVGIIWPASLFIRVFGYSELSYYALPLFSALSLSLGTWLLGRLLFGRVVGVVAGILVVSNPWVLRDVSHLLPDFLSAGLLTLSVVILVYLGLDGRLRGRVSGATVGWLLLAGVLLGWSYLAREYAVILFPAVLLVFLAFRAGLPALAWFGGAALVCWLAELVWGWLVYGNPLVRFFAVGSPRQTAREFETSISGVVWQLPDLFWGTPGGWLFVALFLLALIVVSVNAVRLGGPWRVLAAWFVAGWLFFTLVALLPMLVLGEDRVYLRMHKFRYWALILPPLFVGGVAVIWHMVAKLRGRMPGVMFGGVVLLSLGIPAFAVYESVSSIGSSSAFVRNGATDYLEFRAFMRNVGAEYDKVWIDGRGHRGDSALRSVSIYFREWYGLKRAWDGDVGHFADRDGYVDQDRLGSGLVIQDRTRFERIRASSAPPEYILFPERYGVPAFRSSRGNIQVYDFSADPPPAQHLLGVSTEAWQVIPIGRTDEAGLVDRMTSGGRRIELSEGERVLLMDDTGTRNRHPDVRDARLPASAVAVGNIEVNEISETGRFLVSCYFYDAEDGRRSRVRPALLRDDRPDGSVSVEFSCGSTRAGAHYYRLGVDLIGPMSVVVGDATVHYYQGGGG